jgi:hypothetical protein
MKMPEQAITDETKVIIRLRVTDEFGVMRNRTCGLRKRAKATIPRIIGIRLRTL